MRFRENDHIRASGPLKAVDVWKLLCGQSKERRRKQRGKYHTARLHGVQLRGEELEPLVLLSGGSVITQSTPLILSTAGQTYTLQNDLVVTAGSAVYIAAPHVTLNLNGHTIYYGADNAANDHGVVLYNNWDASQPAYSISGASSPDNATIENGSIVDQGTGATSHTIYTAQAANVTMSGLQLTANGTDAATVYVAYGNSTITNSVLTDLTSATTDRFAGPANVWCQHSTVVASGNVLLGGNSGFDVGNNSQVTGNLISQSNFATNGYGLFNFGSTNVVFSNNIILPVGAHGGPGVLINGAYNDPATNCVVQNNVILNSDATNTEYPGGLNAAAIRVRYSTNGNVISGNTSLGLAGGQFTGASGLSLSDDGSAGTNTISNNSFSVILKGAETPDAFYASAFSPCGQGTGDPSNPADANMSEPSSDVISNNSFQSNDILIRLDNNLGGSCNQLAPVVGNSFSWITGNSAQSSFMATVSAKLSAIGLASNTAALNVVNQASALIQAQTAGVPLSSPHTTWYTKYYTGNDSITLLNSNWGSGVDPTSYEYNQLWQGSVAARVGSSVTAQLLGTNGAPLANTAVQLTTDQGDTYSLTTDATGKVTLPAIQFGIDKGAAQNAPFTVDSRTSSTVTVSGYSPITLSNATLLAQPVGTVVTVNLGGVVTVNHAPSGASKTISILEGGSYTFATTDFGFSDPNDNPSNVLLAVKIATLPANGKLTDNGVAVTAGQLVSASDISSGLLKYTSTAGAYGSPYTTFTFQVEDNGGTANGGANLDPSPKTITVNVNEVNHAPVGTDKTISMPVSSSYVFASADFGFSDPNDSPSNALLAVKITTLPAAGKLTDNGVAVTAGQLVSATDIAAGLLKFTPTAGANGAPYAKFTFQVEDNGGTANGGVNLDPTANTITLNVNSAPAVADVMIASAGWSPSFYAELPGAGLGSAGGISILGTAGTVRELPYSNLGIVTIRFTAGVTVQQSALSVTGVNVPNYSIASFNYNPATFTAVWTLTQPIATDAVTVRFNGAGTTGTSTSIPLMVMPGDVNLDGIVNGQDLAAIYSSWAMANPRIDVAGAGVVNGQDITVVSQYVISTMSSLTASLASQPVTAAALASAVPATSAASDASQPAVATKTTGALNVTAADHVWREFARRR